MSCIHCAVFLQINRGVPNFHIFSSITDISVCIFLFYLLYSSLIQCIPMAAFLPPLLPTPSTSLLSQIRCPSLQKRAGFPGISTRHSKTGSNKTRHITTYQSWRKQHSRGKECQRAGKGVRDNCNPTVRILTRTPSQTHTTYAENLEWTHADSMIGTSVSVSPI